MNKMKTLVAVAAAMFAAAAMAMTLDQARGSIGACAKDGKEMAKVMKQLSAADQAAFIAEVNAAIAKLGGTEAEHNAMYLAVARESLLASAKGNVKNLLAEVVATVPTASLEYVAAGLADSVLNRAADPKVSYTDAQYTSIAEKLLAAIVARTATADEAPVRNAVAAAMLTRAANGSPADLGEKLDAQAGVAEDVAVSVTLPTAASDLFLFDTASNSALMDILAPADFGSDASDRASDDYALSVVPRTNEKQPWNSRYTRDDSEDPSKHIDPSVPEPRPYSGQIF